MVLKQTSQPTNVPHAQALFAAHDARPPVQEAQTGSNHNNVVPKDQFEWSPRDGDSAIDELLQTIQAARRLPGAPPQ